MKGKKRPLVFTFMYISHVIYLRKVKHFNTDKPVKMYMNVKTSGLFLPFIS